MSELHDAALAAGVWAHIEKRAGELKNQAREALRALPFGDSVAGKTGDRVVCKASWTKGRQKVVVRDEAQFLNWVMQHHPSEVIEQVNPAYVRSLKAVDGTVIDANGEPVCGVEVVTGEPYVSIRNDDEAPFLIASMLRSGQVSLEGVREVEQ